MLSSIRLSPEQEAILATAEPPSASSSKLVRITAAAGTGKTTTLLHLAEKCAQLGHSHLTYITFNKSAAADGRARLEQTLGGGKFRIHLEARTLHSCAMMLLSQARGQDDYKDEEVETKVLGEEELKGEIQRVLQREIQEFLLPCFQEISRIARGEPQNRSRQKIQSMEASAEKQVVFFLYKTLVQFCHSQDSLEMFNDHACWSRDYFPAKKFHREERAKLAGFSPRIYNTKSKVSWYANQANRLWEMLGKVRCYDLEMKRAQLLKFECQDMDGCQVAWVSQQYQYSTKLMYMVGDAAQTIYSFRGAKSKYMMELPHPTIDCTLTISWRFGSSIARMANVVLFCKEHCPQTNQTMGTSQRTWKPYRVTGGSILPCQVTDEKLLWQSDKVTLLAFTNVTLLMEALSMLGMMPLTRHDEERNEDLVVPIVSEDNVDFQNSVSIASMPKIHINGKGENSGLKKWRQVLKQIEHIHALSESEDGMILPRRQFPEFLGQHVTWRSFRKEVEDREINRFVAAINIVQKFQHRTMEAMDLFHEEVMRKAYSAEEADIILSTCHAAKGMEWDNVQVCDDFTDEVSRVNCKGPGRCFEGKLRTCSWQFAAKSYGDDLNLLYVACTRAKRLLSIPPPLKLLLEQCDMLHDFIQAKERVKEEPPPKKFKSAGINLFEQQLDNEQASDLYKQVVLKLRTEAGLMMPNQKLMDELLTRMYPEDPEYTVESYPDASASSEVIVMDEPAGSQPDRVSDNNAESYPEASASSRVIGIFEPAELQPDRVPDNNAESYPDASASTEVIWIDEFFEPQPDLVPVNNEESYPDASTSSGPIGIDEPVELHPDRVPESNTESYPDASTSLEAIVMDEPVELQPDQVRENNEESDPDASASSGEVGIDEPAELQPDRVPENNAELYPEASTSSEAIVIDEPAELQPDRVPANNEESYPDASASSDLIVIYE